MAAAATADQKQLDLPAALLLVLLHQASLLITQVVLTSPEAVEAVVLEAEAMLVAEAAEPAEVMVEPVTKELTGQAAAVQLVL